MPIKSDERVPETAGYRRRRRRVRVDVGFGILLLVAGIPTAVAGQLMPSGEIAESGLIAAGIGVALMGTSLALGKVLAALDDAGRYAPRSGQGFDVKPVGPRPVLPVHDDRSKSDD